MTIPVKPQNKTFQTCLMLATAGVLIFACLAIVSTVDFSQPAIAAKPITGPQYAEIRRNQQNMTGVQWDAYDKSIDGRRVAWQGYITDIKPDITGANYVWIDMDNPPDGVSDVFFPYPEDKSLRYSKGQLVHFQGDYDGGITILNFLVNLKDAEIVE